MRRRNILRIVFYLNIALVLAVLGYKAYLNYYLPEFEGIHGRQIEAIDQRLRDRERFRFAVVGNINNSIGIFEQRMIPRLNNSDVEFLVSAGNAVSTGGEDKYQALYGSLENLRIPYLLTFGDHEEQRFGSYRYYEHFGPHYFTFETAGTRFIFLDSTGKTPWRWQVRWLRDVLQEDPARHRIIFMGHPLFPADREVLFDDAGDYLQPQPFREALLELFREFPVDVVFSSNVASHYERREGNTRYITTGGAGGLLLNTETSFYHYIDVSVSDDGIETKVMRIDTGQHPLLRQLEAIWFFIYSLFYVGYQNFILLVGLLILLAFWLHSLVFRERDYYPDYDVDTTPWLEQSFRVAMFTNNYLPFIGGVPISIDRLRRGLEEEGDRVIVVAPRYPDQPEDEADTVRVPALLRFGRGEFRMVNLFLRRIRRQVKAFCPDLIHAHHPFWLGSLGIWMARRLRVPVIYTYHTRLEHYAHYVPLPGLLFRNLISHVLVRRFANRCDGVIVPTYSTEEYLRMIGVKSPIFIQPTGIEYERFTRVEEASIAALKQSRDIGDETVFISVSRLSREKNIDFMIDSLHLLKQRSDHPFRLLILGEGPDRKRLQAHINDLGMDNCITLIGAVPPDEMAVWYRTGDVFLFASKSETQGMVILEAMAAGLPVVAVRSSGIDDAVRQGHNGYKTPQRRSLWSARVQELLEDPALRQQLSGNALAFARDFSVTQCARNTREIYATVLADHASRG